MTPSPASPRRRVLVTGGAGFIGSHLTELLLARGDRVVVIDDLSTGRRDNLPAHPDLEFLHADLAAALAQRGPALGPLDQVYHLAAAVGVRLVVQDPIRCIETNVQQTAALLAFAVTAGPGGSPAPTLVASSSEVYGKAQKSPFSEEDDVVYGPTSKTRWSYACSKAVDEYLALAYHKQHGLPAVVARFFNTVGPRQVGAYGMVLPSFVERALRGSALEVYGDGRQTRCFCDVRDVAGALPRLLENPACHGRVFNLGSDRPISIGGLAELVVRTLGSRSETVLVPYDRAYEAGFEDLRQREPDLTRVRQAIGFAPRIELTRTIHDLATSMPGGRPEPMLSSGGA
ncbi:MAG TPA: NAD-dependent epimerase/dehydratase family protein [Phycisphaerales bacterium]|nr:NAD-dependent epimerase/dehydratase family protein [Phycisphaerales bacterium]